MCSLISGWAGETGMSFDPLARSVLSQSLDAFAVTEPAGFNCPERNGNGLNTKSARTTNERIAQFVCETLTAGVKRPERSRLRRPLDSLSMAALLSCK